MVKSGESLTPEIDTTLLDFIRDYSKRNRYAPTLQEMGDFLGVKRETVKARLDRLQKKGRVTWKAGSQRTVRVVGRR